MSAAAPSLAGARQGAFIAYDGPSALGSQPIVVVCTPKSANAKTGAAWQIWVLCRDAEPFAALRTGADESICGDCAHRPTASGRSCYVSLFTGPRMIFQAMKRGVYPTLSPHSAALRLAGSFVRATAYGDPAAVPFRFWLELLAAVDGWVGYTHQWKTCDPRFKQLFMASVDTEAQRDQAQANGWRTFHARPIGSALARQEFQCPASEEAGHRTTCDNCQLCRGQASPAKSVSIELHGRHHKAKRGDAMRATRAVMLDLREKLARGERVRQQVGALRDHTRVSLALRMFYRRQGQGTRLCTTLPDAAGVAEFWIDRGLPRVGRGRRRAHEVAAMESRP